VATGCLLVLVVGLALGFLAVLPGVSDAEARVRASLSSHGGSDAPLDPGNHVAVAVVAVEDSRFYAHHGIDTRGVARAVIGSIRGGSDPGGSTISQQLAKRLYGSANDGPVAKLTQVGLALKLERQYTKAQILEMYMNDVYFGHGAWGIAAASHVYFAKPPSALDWAEAAMLAGLPQAPSADDPLNDFPAARQRQRHVIDRLVATHVLSTAQADAAYTELTTLRA